MSHTPGAGWSPDGRSRDSAGRCGSPAAAARNACDSPGGMRKRSSSTASAYRPLARAACGESKAAECRLWKAEPSQACKAAIVPPHDYALASPDGRLANSSSRDCS